LKEFGDKLSEGNKASIESALGELKAAHGSQDVAMIEVALEKLNNAWMAASQEMYSAGAADPNMGGTNAGANTNDGGPQAEDAHFEEVK
jgi:molecular chaperone DnaK